ncbi:hypothetical protein WJX84_000564 [Apatococcus fuscideae]|uniref:peptidylprolyl isomerase n=1 Tax=Apatococcus fuscideae TaxID=2026836 RepID=A0AAW1S9X2_9CHLO
MLPKITSKRQPAAAAKLVIPSGPSSKNLDQALRKGEARREELERAAGPIRRTSTGIKYREMEVGTGKEADSNDFCEVSYQMFTQNGLYLDSVGYGQESKKDLGETVRLHLQSGELPEAIRLGLLGMKEGGKRRIEVAANNGWTDKAMAPTPSYPAVQRRIFRVIDRRGVILFEVELKKVLRATSEGLRVS